MTPSPAARPWPLLSALLLLTAALAYTGYRLGQLELQFARQQQQQAADAAVLQAVLGEVTRARIEQNAATKGPAALLERLRHYASLAATSRTAEPDYRAALQEMEATLRAFASLGSDAWPPLQTRLAELQPEKDFDELKWLLEASLRVAPGPAKELLKEILLGRRLPSARLRWYVARMLTDADRPLAQALLRQILRTESSRGINPDRAAAYGAAALDPAAYAGASGFHNFVTNYLRTEDPQTDATLLMLLGQAEHDPLTIQECVKALGERRSQAAVEPIQQLFRRPPLQQENPIFLNHCLDALVAIQGEAARPFLEAALGATNSEVVAKHLQHLLKNLGTPARPTPPPQVDRNSIAPPGKK